MKRGKINFKKGDLDTRFQDWQLFEIFEISIFNFSAMNLSFQHLNISVITKRTNWLSFPTPSMLQDKPKMFAFLFDKYSHIYVY